MLTGVLRGRRVYASNLTGSGRVFSLKFEGRPRFEEMPPSLLRRSRMPEDSADKLVDLCMGCVPHERHHRSPALDI